MKSLRPNPSFSLGILVLSLAAGAHLSAQADVTRYVNGPLSPAAVESNSSVTAITYPDGTVMGEPGVLVPHLSRGETPLSLNVALSGRVNNYGDSHWDLYLDQFYIHIYSADSNTGYLAYAAPIVTLALPRPVDTNGVPIATTPDPLSSSVLPDLPTYAILSGNADYRQHRGYHFAFNFTTQSNLADSYHGYLSPDVLSYIRSNDFILTFGVLAFLPSTGGVRLGIQKDGFGQSNGLLRSVFSSDTAAREVRPTTNFAYAIALQVAAMETTPTIVQFRRLPTGYWELAVDGIAAATSGTVMAAENPTSGWSTTAHYMATGDLFTVQLQETNAAACFRIESAE